MRTEAVPCGDAGEMSLFVWEPAGTPVGSVLLIQEIFGVGPYIRAVAERLAAAGYVVGAPDVSGASPRTGRATTRSMA